jgi:hypothetical protein
MGAHMKQNLLLIVTKYNTIFQRTGGNPGWSLRSRANGPDSRAYRVSRTRHLTSLFASTRDFEGT